MRISLSRTYLAALVLMAAAPVAGAQWCQESKVYPGPFEGTSFGISVEAGEHDTILIGAPGYPDSGSVIAYGRGGTEWVVTQIITKDDLPFDAEMGKRIALSGDTLLVNAPGTPGMVHGATYSFVNDGAKWTFAGELIPDTS